MCVCVCRWRCFVGRCVPYRTVLLEREGWGGGGRVGVGGGWGGLDADKRRRGSGRCMCSAGGAQQGNEGIRAMERGQQVAATNESRPRPEDGCSVVFFRRKQDAVQERHCTLSDWCLLLDGWAARHTGGSRLAGAALASPRRQRKVQPSPAQPRLPRSSSQGESSRVESGSSRGREESSRVASLISLDPRL